MRRVRWLLEIALFAGLSFPVAVMPYRCALKTGGLLGLLLFRVWGGRRRIAVDNIEQALRAGSLQPAASAEAIARESFINLGMAFAEVVRIYYGRGDHILRNVEIRGREHYREAKSRNRGVIFITGHCGNWELLALAFGSSCDRISVVARAQDNPRLNGLIEKVRGRYGNRVIYKKGALRDILSALRKNGTVGILMDQAVVKDEGFITDFLGRGAWTTKMPALIARKTGAAVLPAFIHREGGRHIVTIHPEVRLAGYGDTGEALVENTRLLSGFVEAYIRQHPTEWLWIHRRWKRAGEKELTTEIMENK